MARDLGFLGLMPSQGDVVGISSFGQGGSAFSNIFLFNTSVFRMSCEFYWNFLSSLAVDGI